MSTANEFARYVAAKAVAETIQTAFFLSSEQEGSVHLPGEAEKVAKRLVYQDPWKYSLRLLSSLFGVVSAVMLLPEVQAELVKLLPLWFSAEYIPLASVLVTIALPILSKLRDIRPTQEP